MTPERKVEVLTAALVKITQIYSDNAIAHQIAAGTLKLVAEFETKPKCTAQGCGNWTNLVDGRCSFHAKDKT